MRVKIKGLVDKKRFNEILERIADYLKKSGVEEIQGINFYLTPIHPETGEEAIIVDLETGQEVDTTMINNPTKETINRKSNKIKAVNNNEAKNSQKRDRKRAK